MFLPHKITSILSVCTFKNHAHPQHKAHFFIDISLQHSSDLPSLYSNDNSILCCSSFEIYVSYLTVFFLRSGITVYLTFVNMMHNTSITHTFTELYCIDCKDLSSVWTQLQNAKQEKTGSDYKLKPIQWICSELKEIVQVTIYLNNKRHLLKT